ncbi:integrin-linked kinase-associated serine/threonine phosphatase 2C-like [Saccoglossus kowalevskii]|uniref:Integrin-linked kinase-associated serine/threonine phosphatase 2C-like n=1 Tax=Saccoglossus kowalevskii TaxID=10224 RepID=A0ABM0MJF9_SACKO|nr:PREDICTED: integrin-linked kinase-associated serine/threonine phosphatase 2C-like [Saccoglossus kowalevskii]
MDLFADIPEADNQTKETILTATTTQPKLQNTGPSLFDDLPAETTLKIASKEVTDVLGYIPPKRRKLEEEDKVLSRSTQECLPLKAFVAERKGERNEMQDKHTLIDDFTQSFLSPTDVSRMAFYGVYDGHAGARASTHASQNLHLNIISKYHKAEVSNRDKEIKKCLIESFKKTDDDFLKEASTHKPVWKDGSTALSILVINDILYIANLGDSKAVLCRYNKESDKNMGISLSKEHSPTLYEERQRIQKAGGTVRDGRVMGVLEVSRSIGDGRFKHCGVSCIPEIKRCQLTENDRYIVIACDGLWRSFNSEEALQYIDTILQGESHERTELKTVEDSKYEMACNKIANEAVRRGSADNITVVIIRIG